MIDLHIHTTCSDGTDDPVEILKKAEAQGLTHISITDHSTVEAYFKVDDMGKYYTGRIIHGVEVEFVYRGRLVEFLGYDIDVVKMREMLEEVYIPRDDIWAIQMKEMHTKMMAAGVRFSDGILDTWDRTKHYYPTCHLHADLKKYPENRKFVPDGEDWDNGIQFFRNYISNEKSPYYIDFSQFYPTVQKAYDMIRKAGGKVFIPHIWLFGKDALCFLEEWCAKFEIDGIECFYPAFTKEQTEYLVKFCEDRGYLMSAGSDYHGMQRSNELGTKIYAEKLGWLD